MRRDANHDFEARWRSLLAAGHAGWGGAQHARRAAGWRTRLEALVAEGALPASPARVLELGCGNGTLTALLVAMGFQVAGVDIAATAIDWARRRLAGHDVSLHVGDVTDLPPGLEGPFELVVDATCLHCVVDPQRRHAALSGLARRLVPRGHLMLSHMVAPPGELPEGTHWDRATQRLMRGEVPWRWLPSPARLDAELEAHGFAVGYRHVAENPWWHHATRIARRAA